jgi:hypothetical protein
MTLGIASSWISPLLRHPMRFAVILVLVGFGAAASGFQLGRAQLLLDGERQRLEVLDRWVGSGVASLGDVLSDLPLAGEEILQDLVEGVDGVRAWVGGCRRAAEEAGFRMRIRWGDSGRPLPGRPEIEQVEVILELESVSTTPDATARMEGVLERLAMDRPPFELSRVRWTGSGAGLRVVIVEGRLWIRTSDA